MIWVWAFLAIIAVVVCEYLLFRWAKQQKPKYFVGDLHYLRSETIQSAFKILIGVPVAVFFLVVFWKFFAVIATIASIAYGLYLLAKRGFDRL